MFSRLECVLYRVVNVLYLMFDMQKWKNDRKMIEKRSAYIYTYNYIMQNALDVRNQHRQVGMLCGVIF